MRCRTMAALAYYIQIKLVIGSGNITVVEGDVSGFCPLRDFRWTLVVRASEVVARFRRYTKKLPSPREAGGQFLS